MYKVCYHIVMDNNFFDTIQQLENEYDELQELICQVEVMSDHKLYAHYINRIKIIEPFAVKYKSYNEMLAEIDELKSKERSSEEMMLIEDLEKEAEQILTELKMNFVKSKNRERECVTIEISSKENADFGVELLEILKKYSNIKSLSIETVEENSETNVIKITGENVYKDLGWMSGKAKKVSCGKEFYAGIVVLKNEDNSIEIKEEDLIIQTSKSSGAGGQHINKTESAVKITHIPTGIFAECQDERSQTKNKEKAMLSLLKKITKNSEDKSKKFEKQQRNEIKSKLFSSTPVVVFDFDRNKVFVKNEKSEYKLKDILEGRLDLIINDRL